MGGMKGQVAIPISDEVELLSAAAAGLAFLWEIEISGRVLRDPREDLSAPYANPSVYIVNHTVVVIGQQKGIVVHAQDIAWAPVYNAILQKTRDESLRFI